MLQLSYDVAQATTEEDHAAVHLINVLMNAQAQRQTPMEAMGHAALKNAVKNPVEIQRAAELFYTHVLRDAAQDLLPFRVAAFFLPVVLATVTLGIEDAGGRPFDKDVLVTRMAAVVQRLCEAMHPGFSVNANQVVRPGATDPHTGARLGIGLAIAAVMRDVYAEILDEALEHDAFGTTTSISQG